MSVKNVVVIPNTPAGPPPNTERGPSEIIWAGTNAPDGWVEDYIQDGRLGMHFFDDFLVTGSGPGAATSFQGSLGNWTLFQGSNSGTIKDGSLVGGVLAFVPSSGTVSSGGSTPTVSLRGLAGAFQITANSSGNSALQGRMAFEARVALTSITAGQRAAFIGLTDGPPGNNSPFLNVSAGSSNELASSNNLIGFYNPSSGLNQDWQFVFQLASTAPVFVTNLANLVSTVTGTAIAAGSSYKLGFIFDPLAPQLAISSAANGQTAGATARAMLTVYVNGIKAAAFLTQTQNILTASFPIGVMSPIAAFAAVSNSGTSNSATNLAGLMQLDWVRIAQRGIT